MYCDIRIDIVLLIFYGIFYATIYYMVIAEQPNIIDHKGEEFYNPTGYISSSMNDIDKILTRSKICPFRRFGEKICNQRKWGLYRKAHYIDESKKNTR